MKTLIQRARVLCPAQGIDSVQDVAIAEGRIIGYGDAGQGIADFAADQTIDAQDQIMMPGLIDIATHMGKPNQPIAGRIASEASAAAKNGITTIVCQPDVEPVIDEPSVVQLITRRAKAARASRVYCLAALTRDYAGAALSEMGALKAEGCIGVTNAGQAIKDSLVLRRAMQYAASFDLPIIMNPLDAWLGSSSGGHEGELTTRMGLTPISVAAETCALLRDIAIADDLGVGLHVGRLSSGASIEWISAAKQNQKKLSCDTAIYQLLLSDIDTEGFNALAHVSPPLRSHRDRVALFEGLQSGVIDILTSAHRPLSLDAKDGPFGETSPGISGLDTLLGLVWHLIDQYDMPLLPTLATVTTRPAKLLGLETGSLAVGKAADFILLEQGLPNPVETASFHSAGKNSPFDDWWLPARVMQTWVGGDCVYARES